jgi:hypothetical protein
VRNETAASGCTPEAAHERPPTTPQSITEGAPRRKSSAAWFAPQAPLLARELLDFLLTVPDAAVIVLVPGDPGVTYSARRDAVEIRGEVAE